MEESMKLVIQIKNNTPLELIDFSKSMIAAGEEYKSYRDLNEIESSADDAKLYIKEIRNGCIIAELIAIAPYALQFTEHASTVLGYAEHLKDVIDVFFGKKGGDVTTIEKTTLNNMSDIINPVAMDNGSQMNIAALNINNIEQLTFNLDSKDANALQNKIRNELERRKEPDTGLKQEVVLYWVQTRGDGTHRAGDRGKIESLYVGDVKVRLPDDLKEQMITEIDFPFKKAFIVDVDVQTVEGKPILYNVKKLHDIIDK